ncbi:MFS transporter [Francisella endosymbiont of Amblyomma maculatum]|nr:MFS transporter [Francisella endosymbiont of Amblyomma maculatum]
MDKNKIVAYTIGLIMLIELIDGSALNIALPQIANDLHINAITLKIAITVYLLALGLFIPASGWISDKIGSKNLLILSITGFMLSSIACGLSTNLTSLVIFRAIQGAFGAFTAPVARLVMVRIYKNDVLTAMSIVAVIAALGPILGPLFGGVITTHIGWRMIFFINVPIVVIAVTLIYLYLPNIRSLTLQKFDLKGFIIIGTSIALMMFFIDLMIDTQILVDTKWLLLIFAVILFSIYIRHAQRLKDNAVINLTIFNNCCFRYFTIISSTSRLLIMGMSFIFPLYLQTKQGFSAFESGLFLMFFLIPAWFVKKFVRRVLARLHFYKFFIICLCLMATTYLGIGWIFIHFNLLVFTILLSMLGLCFGMFTMISNAGIYNSIQNDTYMSAATVINSSIIQLTNAFAISWVGIVLATFSGINHIDFTSKISLSAFAAVQFIYSIGLLVILIYVVFYRPNNLNSVPIS